MIFYCEKKNGIVEWGNARLMQKHIDSLPNGKLSVDIKRYRKKRTDNQNSLYWLWLETISKDTGFHPDELHATFRAMFLTDKTKRIPLVRSTTALNSLEFMSYLNRIEQKSAELGIELPNPEDHWAEYTSVV